MSRLFIDVFFYGMVRSTLSNANPAVFRGINRMVHEYARRSQQFVGFDQVHWFGSRLPNITKASFEAAGLDLIQAPPHPSWRETWLNLLNAKRPNTAKLRKLQALLRWPLRARLMEQFYVPQHPERQDLWLSTCTYLTPQVRALGLKRVLMCHDLNHVFHFREMGLNQPDTHPLANLALNLQSDEWAICISEYTRKCLLEYHPHLNPDRAFVIPLGADLSPHHSPTPSQAVLERHHLTPKRYFMTLAAGGPHKNSHFLIEEFTTWHHAANPTEPVKLVLVGLGQDFLIPQMSGSATKLWKEGHIIFTGFLADEDLPVLYGNSLAFVFASLAEGFGLPPLEAMLYGSPVICSDRTSLPEVVGDAGLLFDPTQKGALSHCLGRMTREPQLRQILSEKSTQRAAQYTWDRSTQALVETLHHIASSQ